MIQINSNSRTGKLKSINTIRFCSNFCRRHYKIKFDIDPGYIF